MLGRQEGDDIDSPEILDLLEFSPFQGIGKSHVEGVLFLFITDGKDVEPPGEVAGELLEEGGVGFERGKVNTLTSGLFGEDGGNFVLGEEAV